MFKVLQGSKAELDAKISGNFDLRGRTFRQGRRAYERWGQDGPSAKCLSLVGGMNNIWLIYSESMGNLW